MKNLNIYISEGLADWEDDKILNKKISKQSSKSAIQQEIFDWIKSNTQDRIYKNKFKFDFSALPITVNYNGNIRYATTATSLTSEIFQWGEVGGNFECSFCGLLESLEGAPEKVRGTFKCNNCGKLKTLKGAPKEVYYFECSYCESLTTLEGAPEKVKDVFSCSNNISLKSLKGAPKEIGSSFSCSRCQSLKSLKYGPEIVGGNFRCSRCPNLTSLEYAPKEVVGSFLCKYCGVKFTEEDVKKVSKVYDEICC